LNNAEDSFGGFEMTGLVKFLGGFAVAAMLAAIPAVAGAAEDKDVIDYRQHIMETLDAQTAAIGMIVSTQITEENLVAHAEAIALTAKQALISFKPKVAGGESKPEVWTNWADFEKRMNDFVEKTDKLAKSAKTGGVPVVMEQMVDALTCKSCHDLYRQKK
jgi:cytochrome c556